ncbi:MAG: hypothetical protein ACKVPY_17010 [Paracoccaceae bacterium]
MDEIEDFGQRIADAFDRIARGLEAVGAAPLPHGASAVAGGEAGEAEALREALQSEQAANQQLTERVRAIREKQETVVAALERNLARATQQLDAQGRELARLRRANDTLIAANRDLQRSAAAGIADPAAADGALRSELEALRADRAAEIAELDGILSELKPLVEEVA